jgi:uncharacterized lipoprotein YmbA
MKYLLLPILVVIGACASQAPDTTEYLLRSDTELQSRELVPSAKYRLGYLQVADYIDKPGLVLETGDGVIHVARNHQWAEPLRISLRSFLAAEVSALLGEDIFFEAREDGRVTIDITIDQLHGSGRGEAKLLAYWRLTEDEGNWRTFRFVESQPLQRDGYQALAEAEKSLLRRLAAKIAESLTDRPQNPE